MIAAAILIVLLVLVVTIAVAGGYGVPASSTRISYFPEEFTNTAVQSYCPSFSEANEDWLLNHQKAPIATTAIAAYGFQVRHTEYSDIPHPLLRLNAN